MEINNKIIRKGFTLIELLIVIAILGVLGAIVIFLLNPAETLKKARDSQRLSDLSTMKTALGIYMSSIASPDMDGSFTTSCSDEASKKIFISYNSIASTTASSFSYATTSVASSTLVNGQGWVPVNLTVLTGGSPISTMPVDPINTCTDNSGSTCGAATAASSTSLMYRYSCKKNPIGFEIDAQLESSAYTVTSASAGTTDMRTIDGGDNAGLYEVGSDLTILPASGSF